MNILISGNLASLAITLAEQLAKRKHRIVIASDGADQLSIQSSNVITHSANPADEIFKDAISSYGFDIVIYLATREEQLNGEMGSNTGHQLDGLRNILEMCRKIKLKHFFYISSTEVYGEASNRSEQTVPQPVSLNGHILMAGEQFCRIYHDKFDLKITILRLTNIYGPKEKNGLLYQLITTCNSKEQVVFPASESTEISLLHALDVTDFIIRALDEEYASEALIVNLSASSPMKYSDIAQLLHRYYPKAQLSFKDDGNIYTKPAQVAFAKRVYDWIDTYVLESEFEDLVEQFNGEKQPIKSFRETIGGKLTKYPEVLKWIELIGGTVLIHFLSEMTGTLIQFKYVDFRLLFVVVMGSIYGIRTGLYAAALASISILYTWMQLGFDWALLIYNIGNWLPFALYFTAGLITGYYHDKSENQILNAQKQTNLILDKYSFLYSVFNEIRNLKDEFRERLLGYRDSFGKIYTIASELDQLQEHAIYLRALNILEEHMDNRNIAIYSLNEDKTHARLEASSTSLNGSILKSLNLSKFQEIQPCIETGTIFQNSQLLPDYPAYVVPIFNDAHPFKIPAVMIVFWSAKFEQYSTYYYNRLKVICGLIQSSLVRANMFSNANDERIYLPKTRVLTHQAFMDALKIRVEMKKNKVSDFQLLMMETPENGLQEIYPSIAEGIRNRDVVGLGGNGDYYILLSQADKLAAQDIAERLTKFGIQGRIVDTNQVLLDQWVA